MNTRPTPLPSSIQTAEIGVLYAAKTVFLHVPKVKRKSPQISRAAGLSGGQCFRNRLTQIAGILHQPGSTPLATITITRMSSPRTITRAAALRASIRSSQHAVKLPGKRSNRRQPCRMYADVVYERPAREARDQGSSHCLQWEGPSSPEPRPVNRKRAWDGERKIRQVVRYAAAHLESRKRRGTDALDDKVATRTRRTEYRGWYSVGS